MNSMNTLPMASGDATLARAEEQFRRRVDQLFRRSLHIRHVDAGSCNACESEVKLLTSPYYDIHRLGLFFTPSPRHADLLLVTGASTRAMEEPLRRTYAAMPDPRLVVAVGACASGGGVFAASPYTRGKLSDILPVDVLIPGCPPTPLSLIHGLLALINRLPIATQGAWSDNADKAPRAAVMPDMPDAAPAAAVEPGRDESEPTDHE